MKRIMLLTALAGAVAIGSTGIASAQVCSAPGVLTSVKGNVLVSSGGAFSVATVGTPVQLGYKVTVQGPGSAVAKFGTVNVSVPSSTTLTLSIPGCSPTINQSVLNTPVMSPTAVIGTTIVVGGGVAAAIAIANNNDSKKFVFFPPLSP